MGFVQGDRNPKRRAKRLHDLSDVSSVGIMARGKLDEYRFNMYMRDLLSEKARDIFRCKGVLSVHVSGVAMHDSPAGRKARKLANARILGTTLSRRCSILEQLAQEVGSHSCSTSISAHAFESLFSGLAGIESVIRVEGASFPMGVS